MFFDQDADCDIDHSENCEFCDAVVTLFKILNGLLDRMQPYIPPVTYNKALYKLRKSEYHVNTFKGYQMRTTVTRKVWRGLKQRVSESVVYVTFDYPMKYFLKQYRGTTTGWYGKVNCIPYD